ncbi:aminoglycoside phosphotransferase (APT) family kinase protein [Kribbella amoyensis]|uniref:Aminoglycoside phosphotransferase (APT) family kinase protein n=1 Tax=Kribbella amoyensis TaxID=996641 RepID=A0A561BR67_9ACTN|nr:phosphotransferase [Kribbella amoyensis]TWD81374.1 aminoglycoside phosphotransferase (APT) family kinase protein [Kribbella amoyensis]
MDETALRDLIGRRMPGYRIESVEPIGSGLDNSATLVNGDLVVRSAKDGDAATVEREARLLAIVAGVSPLPTPEPLFVESATMAYRSLAGVPLIEQDASDVPPVAAQLDEFLRALHSAPIELFADLVEADVVPLAEWLDEAAEGYAGVREQIPARYRAGIDLFLGAAPPADPEALVFSHNDLGIEHVLVESGVVSGVIDWTDAALTDPAYDYGLLQRDLGPAAPACPSPLVERATFYARCSVFEDLAYGLETGRDQYTAKCLRSLDWLFS